MGYFAEEALNSTSLGAVLIMTPVRGARAEGSCRQRCAGYAHTLAPHFRIDLRLEWLSFVFTYRNVACILQLRHCVFTCRHVACLYSCRARRLRLAEEAKSAGKEQREAPPEGTRFTVDAMLSYLVFHTVCCAVVCTAA